MSNLDPVVQIGDWNYQVIYGQLWPVGTPMNAEQLVRLEPRLHSLLNFFLLHPNTLLAKDTLIEKVWPADEGTDAAVMRAVGALRKVLGDDVRAPNYIATVSKKGYCWLAQIKTAPAFDHALLPSDDSTNALHLSDSDNGAAAVWPWRFIAATVCAILLGCASLAYVLATYTATPLIKLPDTILPISALSGQEFWPVLNAAQTHVLYQHKAPGNSTLNWSLQDLTDLKVLHLSEQYQQLSQAQWLDGQQIIFRGKTGQGCYFYQQQIAPAVAPPARLWPCQNVVPQGLLQWQQQWIWLDVDDQQHTQLWSAKADHRASMLQQFPPHWHSVEHMLLRGDTLYLLVQETQHNSALYQLALPGGKPQLVSRFSYIVSQFSWWDDMQLLLAPLNQDLQIYDLKHNSSQSLGPLTRQLIQALRYPGQVLATQYLDYTTDIFSVANAADADNALLQPWHVSNRSERLLARANGQAAFVSERAGHSQIWLEQGPDSTQLSRLHEQQTVQQLLWHQQQLLVLVNAVLYQLNPTDGSMTHYPLQGKQPGRYASCNEQLYWTELSEQGWQLYRASDNEKQAVHNNVVDVRCGPEQSLLVQFADRQDLALLSAQGDMQPLPLQINWRTVNSEQWFTDSSGVYYLDATSNVVQHYHWQSGERTTITLPQAARPVAIYSNGAGLGYIVQPRPFDSDIVWLQNRR